jgi:hypothetical protein
MCILASAVAALTLMPSASAVQDDVVIPGCEAQERAVAALESEYGQDIKAVQDEGDDIERDAPSGPRISGTIKFETTRVALHLPSITMRNREFSMNLPQMTTRQRGFSWKVPEVRMETRVVARVPSLRCTWLKCKTYMKEIKTDVPVTTMVLKRASTNIPEFRMARTSFTTKIPTVKMVRQDLIYKLPHITIANPIPETGPTEARGEALNARATQLTSRMEADGASRTEALYSCYLEKLVEQRATVAASFETGIAELNKAINVAKSLQADPTAFKPDDGDAIDLVAQRSQLIVDRDAALAQIDDAIKALADRTNIDVPAASAPALT